MTKISEHMNYKIWSKMRHIQQNINYAELQKWLRQIICILIWWKKNVLKARKLRVYLSARLRQPTGCIYDIANKSSCWGVKVFHMQSFPLNMSSPDCHLFALCAVIVVLPSFRETVIPVCYALKKPSFRQIGFKPADLRNKPRGVEWLFQKCPCPS